MKLSLDREFLTWGLLLILVLALIYVIKPHQANYLRHFQMPQLLIEAHQPLTVADVPLIQSWMTFDYLNRVFGLPAYYLASVLEITDEHYPNLVIKHYALDNGMDLQAFSAQVQTVVAEYLSLH